MGGQRNQTSDELQTLSLAVTVMNSNPLVVNQEEVKGGRVTYTELANFVGRAKADNKLIAGETGGKDHVGGYDSATGTITIDLEKSSKDVREIAATMIHEAAHGHGYSEKSCQSIEIFFLADFGSFDIKKKKPESKS